MSVLKFQIIIFIIFGLNLSKCLAIENFRAQSEFDRQIKSLQNENQILNRKLELLNERLRKLEDIIEKKSNCENCNEEIPKLLQQWIAVLKEQTQNQGTKLNSPQTPSSSEEGSSLSSNIEPKNYNSHFECISNCENFTQFPKNCGEALAVNKTGDGIYQLYLPSSNLKPFSTYCLQDFLGDNAWIVIQRRQFGVESFKRNWTDYKYGFGDLNGDYWLGLERIHALTKSRKYELWIQLKDQSNVGKHANYDEFAIAGEDQWYKLSTLTNYTGDAGNSLGYNNQSYFSTFDGDNDVTSKENCAEKRMGGWWFKDCKESNPNGVFNSTDYGTGINWIDWHDYNYSLKYVHIAIRPLNREMIQRIQMMYSFKKNTTVKVGDET